MTMLDDELAALLAEAAATFEVPPSGPDDIVHRALGRGAVQGDPGGGEAETTGDAAMAGAPLPMGRVHRLVHSSGRHRVLSAAAVLLVLLVLAGAIGTLVRGPTHRTVTAAPSHAPATVPAPVSTTTTPPAFSSNGLAQARDAAPRSAGTKSGASKGTQGTTTPTGTPNLPNGAVGLPAKIEQTGSLALTVGHGTLSRTIAQLTTLAGANGGFVANSQTQSGAAAGSAPSGSVTLQVPVQSFATVLQRAEALGKTSDLMTKATDVSGQYVDLQSRLAALEASRQQYLTILAKATTVGDVLAVQEQLDSIQSQIEQLQGQLQLLTGQTSYSTLTVTVSERNVAPSPSRLPESGLVRAWHTSIGGFVTGVEGVIRLAGPLLFALLLTGTVLLGGRVLWRRYQRHNL